MKFITSLSLNRIEHQQCCIRSWLPHGNVVAVQSKPRIEMLRAHFPFVEFIETKSLGTGDGRHMDRARVSALIEQSPGLLINSDIEICKDQQSFASEWQEEAQVFKVGIRTDYEHFANEGTINQYGVDAFLVTEELKACLPDCGFTLGVSVWDYWIIWHAITSRFAIDAKTQKGVFRHLKHNSSWGTEDTEYGMRVMQTEYRMDKKKLDVLIPLFTNRVRATVQKPKRRARRKAK